MPHTYTLVKFSISWTEQEEICLSFRLYSLSFPSGDAVQETWVPSQTCSQFLLWMPWSSVVKGVCSAEVGFDSSAPTYYLDTMGKSFNLSAQRPSCK